MKVLLFTHASDIDGMGSAILGKLAFDELDYVLCETHSINNEVQVYIDTKKIYKYDYIYVTDLCIRGEVVSYIKSDKHLNKRFLVFDHHKSEMAEDTINVPFIRIVIKNEKGICSGTSLFYEYLLANGYFKHSKSCDELVELIRQYDTWEWKNIYNNEEALELKVLFDILGNKQFIDNMTYKLMNNNSVFTNDEKEQIANRINENSMKVDNIISKLIVKKIEGVKVGIVYNMDYELRNEVAEKLRKNNANISYVIFEIKEKNSVSLRSIDNDFDISSVAIKLGGKGHKNAASCPISEAFYKFIK